MCKFLLTVLKSQSYYKPGFLTISFHFYFISIILWHNSVANAHSVCKSVNYSVFWEDLLWKCLLNSQRVKQTWFLPVSEISSFLPGSLQWFCVSVDIKWTAHLMAESRGPFPVKSSCSLSEVCKQPMSAMCCVFCIWNPRNTVDTWQLHDYKGCMPNRYVTQSTPRIACCLYKFYIHSVTFHWKNICITSEKRNAKTWNFSYLGVC